MANTKKKTRKKTSAVSKGKGKHAAAKATPVLAPGMTTFKCRFITLSVFIFLGIFSSFGYFELGENGKIIQSLYTLFKGLFGWGFFVAPPLLILAGILLVIRYDRPYAIWRSSALLGIVPVFGGIMHLITSAKTQSSASWASGISLDTGGLFSGNLAALLVKLLSGAGAWILLVLGGLFLLAGALNVDIKGIFTDYHAGAPERAERREAIKAERAEIRQAERSARYDEKQIQMIDRRREAEETARRTAEERKQKEEAAKLGLRPRSSDTAATTSSGKRAYDQFADKAPGETKAGAITPIETLREPRPDSGTAAAPAASADNDLQKRSFENLQQAAAQRQALIQQGGIPGRSNPNNQAQSNAAAALEELPTFIKDETAEEHPFAPTAEEEPPVQPENESSAEVAFSGEDEPTAPTPSRHVDVRVRPVSPSSQVDLKVAQSSYNRAQAEAEEHAGAINRRSNKNEPLPEFVPNTETDCLSYQFPDIGLLHPAEKPMNLDAASEARAASGRLEEAFRSFGVNLTVANYTRGPNVTRYEAEIEAGTKLSKLTNLEDDIALALGSSGVRIAAVPNKAATVGIEVPNNSVSTVYLREIIESDNFKNAKSRLTFALGKSIAGEAEVGNISKLPHLLIAGTTGSGKSVCLNSLILSLLYKATPDEVKFIMIDPKMVEFKIYNGIPHLMSPVVTDPKKAAGALQWAVVEMMKRYRFFSDENTRDLDSYNQLMAERIAQGDTEAKILPRVVIIIDELADLMMVAAKEVEDSICRIAQMGRAAGMHLVVATQSPRADVITGLIKANIPSRCALKVSSSLESRIILDSGGGAEKLIGNGDMLYSPTGSNKPKRIQGTWVSDEEREEVINYLKDMMAQNGAEVEYDESITEAMNQAAEGKGSGKSDSGDSGNSAGDSSNPFADYDDMLPSAVDVALDAGQISVSMLQRRLKLGYARAARIVDQMEELGIIGPYEGAKPRPVLLSRMQWQEMQMIQGTAPIESLPAEEASVFPDYEAGDPSVDDYDSDSRPPFDL